MTIRVFDRGAVREAEVRSSVAVRAVLELMGIERDATHDAVPLGDALAAISSLLGLGTESDILASGMVDSDGGVTDVMTAVGTLASHPAALYVVPDGVLPDASFAESLRASMRTSSEAHVIGVLTLGEAADRLFDLSGRGQEGTLVPAEARARARTVLFRRIVEGKRLALDWPAVAAIAIGLWRHAADDDHALFELAFIRDVARRHDGGTAIIPWPHDELQAYPPETRARIVAHVVQSASDGGLGLVGEYVGYARKELDSLDSGLAEALELRGAVGRALAAVGSYAEAQSDLEVAVNAWLVRDPARASHPLCELLRVAGIRREQSLVLALLGTAERVSSRANGDTTAYLALATGRALVQVGLPRLARDILSGARIGGGAPRHVRSAKARWLARAEHDVGELGLAERTRAELGSHFESSDQVALAGLDAAAGNVERIRGCLDALLVCRERAEASATLERLAPGLSTYALAERKELIEALREEYRY